MAFYITENGDNQGTILTDGGYLKLGNGLSVDATGEEPTLNASGGGGGTGTVNNIKVNGVTGTVASGIASATINSGHIKVVDYADQNYDNYPADLKITVSSTPANCDSITTALSKMQTAWLQNERNTQQSVESIKNASGFDQNLGYVPYSSDSIIGTAESLSQADFLLSSAVGDIQSEISVYKNGGINFTGGASGSFRVGQTDTYGQGRVTTVSIPKRNFINITDVLGSATGYGGTGQYFTLAVIQAMPTTLANGIPTAIAPQVRGTVYTWETSDGVWVIYQYVGELDNATHWADNGKWVLIHGNATT